MKMKVKRALVEPGAAAETVEPRVVQLLPFFVLVPLDHQRVAPCQTKHSVNVRVVLVRARRASGSAKRALPQIRLRRCISHRCNVINRHEERGGPPFLGDPGPLGCITISVDAPLPLVILRRSPLACPAHLSSCASGVQHPPADPRCDGRSVERGFLVRARGSDGVPGAARHGKPTRCWPRELSLGMLRG